MAQHRHGHSIAAWTAVAILLVASFLICLAVVLMSRPLAIVGLVLVVVGVLAGKLLAVAGLGRSKPDRPSKTSAIR